MDGRDERFPAVVKSLRRPDRPCLKTIRGVREHLFKGREQSSPTATKCIGRLFRNERNDLVAQL
jgi:hypothetical protein